MNRMKSPDKMTEVTMWPMAWEWVMIGTCLVLGAAMLFFLVLSLS